MMDWRRKYYPKGTPVKVTSANHKLLGTGILLTDYRADSIKNDMPKIRMPQGKIYYGYECWWIPVNETKPIRKGRAG